MGIGAEQSVLALVIAAAAVVLAQLTRVIVPVADSRLRSYGVGGTFRYESTVMGEHARQFLVNHRSQFPLLIMLLAAIAPTFYLTTAFIIGSLSPDAVSGYLGAKQVAETGKLYISDPLTAAQPDGPTSFWFYVADGDRAVPLHPVGFIWLAGMVHSLFGDSAAMVLAIIPAVTFVGLAFVLRMLRPTAPPFAVLAFLGLAPLWYWAAQTYMNVGMYSMFLVLGVGAIALATRRRSWEWLYGGYMLLALAAFARVPEAPFLLLLAFPLTIMFLRRVDTRFAAYRRAVIAYAIIQLGLFVIPLLLLNHQTYGSAFTIGYNVAFDDISAGSSFSVGSIFSVLFPTKIDFSTFTNNLFFRTFMMMPFMTSLAIVGFFTAREQIVNLLGKWGTGVLVIAFLYLLISRANPESWAAGDVNVNLDVSIVRYWMPFYLLLGISAVYMISTLPRNIAIALVVALVAGGFYQIWLGDPKSLQSVRADMELYPQYETALLEHTEPESVVFAGSRTDKWTVPLRRTVSWRADSPWNPATAEQVATSAVAARELGSPVYFLLGAEDDRDGLLDALNTSALGLQQVANPQSGVTLERLFPQPVRVRFEEDCCPVGSSGTFASPGEDFDIRVLSDGSGFNFAKNPSYETGFDTWGIPAAVADQISLDDSWSSSGENSARFEMQAGATQPVRMNATMDVAGHRGEQISVRSRVLVEEITDARAQVRLLIQDEDGELLDLKLAQAEPETSETQVLSISEIDIPADADNIVLQLILIPDSPESTGVLNWDAIEVTEGRLTANYLDGDQPTCRWADKPHQSESICDGGFEALSISTGEGEFQLDGPFHTGDVVRVTPDRIVVTVSGESTVVRDAFTALPPAGSPVDISVSGTIIPVMEIAPLIPDE